MYVTRYAWEMGGSLGIRGCSNTSQQEQFVTSNQSAYNSFAAPPPFPLSTADAPYEKAGSCLRRRRETKNKQKQK